MFGAGYFNPDYFGQPYFGADEGTAGAASGAAYGSSTATATARIARRRTGNPWEYAKNKRDKKTVTPIAAQAAGQAAGQAIVSGLVTVWLYGPTRLTARGTASGTALVAGKAAAIDRIALQDEQDMRDISDILMLMAA